MIRSDVNCQYAYAKINLTLEVISQLPDGYHEYVSVMQQVQLHDDILIQNRMDGDIVLISELPDVPLDHRNIVWQAVTLIQNQYSINYGAEIHIIKRIPVAAGLAGGSSDAAATLKGLNEIWDLRLSQDEMMKLGESLGMDVPFFLLGGTALATGKGQKVKPLSPLPELFVVIANPGVYMSTKVAYENLDQKLDWTHRYSRFTPLMLSALDSGQIDEIFKYLYNDFELIITQKVPEISLIKETMLAHGAQNAVLSGSGPSVFCMVTSIKQAEEIAHALQHMVPFHTITKTICC